MSSDCWLVSPKSLYFRYTCCTIKIRYQNAEKGKLLARRDDEGAFEIIVLVINIIIRAEPNLETQQKRKINHY